MSGQKILIPFNFSRNDRKALEFAMRTFASLPDVEIILFHAYTPPPKIEASRQTVTAKLSSSISFINKRIADQKEALHKELETLCNGGVDESKLSCVFEARNKDVAAEIIAQANKWRCQIVVLNHKSGKITRFFTGTVFTKVVTALTNTTVCIVS
jgi:hypothetical protein